MIRHAPLMLPALGPVHNASSNNKVMRLSKVPSVSGARIAYSVNGGSAAGRNSDTQIRRLHGLYGVPRAGFIHGCCRHLYSGR